MTYDGAGSYDVTLTVSNVGGGNAMTQTGLVVVEDVPQAGFSFITSGHDVSFTNTSQNATSYTWDFGDGNTSTEENPVHSFSFIIFGEFEVTLTVANICGMATFTDTLTFIDVAVDETGQLDYSLSASPNPFSGQLWVSYELKNAFEKTSLVACNVLGEVVAEMPIHAASGTVSLADELDGSGIFFLRLVVDGRVGDVIMVVRF
ncbi:MAG: PKD domain-containing protein [Bacteroidetes bacterium]|nr:PKD domain-containing protein [Bacteroidota bacterium]